MAKELATPELYCLAVTLRDSNPPIWRMIVVSSDTTLANLHVILQATMGWENAHMHEFVIAKQRYGILHTGWTWFGPKDEIRVQLGQVVRKPRTSFLYEYDFGDQWQHDVEFLNTVDPGLAHTNLSCLNGQGKCPPEDCGGIDAYQDMLCILDNPQHPDYPDVRQYLGKRFNPAAFSKSNVNARLKNCLRTGFSASALF